jgi:hypothetical protein
VTAFAAAVLADLLTLPIPGSARKAYTWAPQFSGQDVHVNEPLALKDPGVYATYLATGGRTPPPHNNWQANQGDEATPAFDWFEKFHVIPRSFAFGNIVSTQTAAIEVYNSSRRTNHDWLTFVNNAGAGVTLLGEPALPSIVRYQHGDVMSVQVSTNGPPRVNSTLDFTFDIGNTIRVPITLQRVVLFGMQPEAGYVEHLEFLTDVLRHLDGTEQRVSLRKCPRQIFEWNVILADGPERARVENVLFDWQSQAFGVAIWHEASLAPSAITAGATTITLTSTANADYRDGGLFLIYQDQLTYDVLQLASHTGTTLTSSTAVLNSYPAGTLVMPLRTALTNSSVSGSRWRLNGAQLQLRFQVNDNDADLSSTAGWNTFNSKVLVDVGTVVQDTLSESYDRELVVLDSQTGLISQTAVSDRGTRMSVLTLRTGTPAELWKVRQLLHALRGKQTSFYLPTFFSDLVVAANISSGSNTMVVTYCGYSQFVRNRQPKNAIRLTLADGSTVTNTITGSSYTSGPNETLTVGTNWGANILAANVVRVEFLEKVRWDTDTITLQHTPGERAVRIYAPVRTVLD